MLFKLRTILSGFFIIIFTNNSIAFETVAKSAIILDTNSKLILMQKNADLALPPASMSKLMTLNMVFEALEDGRLRLDDTLPVSKHAEKYGGSTMFLTTQDTVTVEELIRGVVVLSGNDASAVLAEALSPDGTEIGFAKMMTKRAKSLGMKNSTFENSNGMPSINHKMSVRDLSILADRLISVFPQYYSYFAENEFRFKNRAPDNRFNRNPLLKMNIGADGLKTGHTRESGYGLVGSAVQGDRRIIFIISGLRSDSLRAREAKRMATWAFRQFTTVKLAEKGEIVGEAAVWLGSSKNVNMVVQSDIDVLAPVLEKENISTQLVYSSPINAPITAGTKIAELIVSIPELADKSFPIVAGETVTEGNFWGRFKASAEILGKLLVTKISKIFQ
jgi:D-alanyl-D-alanine carboxypeptidase (penicillin-binding protein 5/6)|tara:strand:+ start:26 stop:1195 length:1170 start_codon:yes stop_codon:yes gene_type:complete